MSWGGGGVGNDHVHSYPQQIQLQPNRLSRQNKNYEWTIHLYVKHMQEIWFPGILVPTTLLQITEMQHVFLWVAEIHKCQLLLKHLINKETHNVFNYVSEIVPSGSYIFSKTLLIMREKDICSF